MPRPLRGSVRERGTGVWEVRVGGKSRTVRGTRADADQKVRDMLTAIHHDEPIEGDGTFGDLLTRWLDIRETQVERSTWERYRRDADNYLRPALGKKLARKVTVAELDRLYADMRKRGLTAAIANAHAVARAAFKQAVDWDELRSSPADRVKLPKWPKPAVRAVEVAEVLRLIDLAEQRNPDLATYIFLSGTTSVRRGEMCGLQWGDIDWPRQFATIARAIADVEDGYYVKLPKTDRVRREPLGAASLAALELHRQRMEQRAAEAHTALVIGAYVFSSQPDGSEPYRPKTMTNDFTYLRTSAGLGHVHLHSLRHFAPTHLLANGEDPRAMADRMGHSNQTTTLSIYAQYLPLRGRELAERADALLAREEAPPSPSADAGRGEAGRVE